MPDRKDCGMPRLHVRNFPHVGRILSQWIPAPFTLLRPLVITLARIFLWHPYRIKIEVVVAPFCKPEDCLMSSTESAAGVDTMPKGPNNAITEEKLFLLCEDSVDQRVEWNHH